MAAPGDRLPPLETTIVPEQNTPRGLVRMQLQVISIPSLAYSTGFTALDASVLIRNFIRILRCRAGIRERAARGGREIDRHSNSDRELVMVRRTLCSFYENTRRILIDNTFHFRLILALAAKDDRCKRTSGQFDVIPVQLRRSVHRRGDDTEFSFVAPVDRFR